MTRQHIVILVAMAVMFTASIVAVSFVVRFLPAAYRRFALRLYVWLLVLLAGLIASSLWLQHTRPDLLRIVWVVHFALLVGSALLGIKRFRAIAEQQKMT